MRRHISDTASYGDLSCNSRLCSVLEPVMRELLADIRTGRFAEAWIAEGHAGQPRYQAMCAEEAASAIEAAGERVRELPKWSDDHGG